MTTRARRPRKAKATTPAVASATFTEAPVARKETISDRMNRWTQGIMPAIDAFGNIEIETRGLYAARWWEIFPGYRAFTL